MAVPLPKRPNDLFVSYGHSDRSIVKPAVDWLDKSVGLKLWYDATSGSAAQRTTDLLSRGIESARGALFFISPNWGSSTWCRDEHEVALTQRRSNSEFVVVAAQVADVEIPAWFQTAQVLDFRNLDILSASALLRSLTANPPLRVDNEQDIYFAGPWSNQSTAVKRVLRTLGDMGWRLVGDAQDHPKFGDSVNRITEIISSCRGLVAVLPFRAGSEPHHTSQWVIEEVQIARSLGRPYLLMAEDGVTLPRELVEQAYGAQVLPLTVDGLDRKYQSDLQAFDDILGHVLLSL